MDSTLGKHIIIELYTNNKEILNNKDKLSELFKKYIKLSKANIINEHIHTFHPQGVSGTFTLSESHMCFHTWPETGYASIDLYTCGDSDPENILNELKNDFNAELNVIYIKRGIKSDNEQYKSKILWHKEYS